MCPCIPDRIGIWQCWFLRSGEDQSTRRKTSRSKERTNNKLNPHTFMMPGLGIKPWWEASVLITCATPAPLNNGSLHCIVLRAV